MASVKAAILMWTLVGFGSWLLDATEMVNLSVICMSIFVAAEEIIKRIDEVAK